MRKSELLIQTGNRREALELLARARAIDPASDEVHLLSVAAMLGELRENLNADGALVETLDRLIDRPAERAELLSLRVRGELVRNEYAEAMHQLIGLSKLIGNQPRLDGAADQVVGDPTRHCSLDSWLAARVNDIVDRADTDELAQVNELLSLAIEPQLEGADSLLNRVVRHFGPLEGAAAARSELAARLAKAGESLQLERLALGLAIPTDEGLRPLDTDRLLTLAEAYTGGRLAADARAVIGILESRDDPDIAENLQQLSRLADQSTKTVRWPEYATLTWESQQINRSRGFPMIQGQRMAKTNILGGQYFRNWRLVSDGASPLALRDGTGQLRPIALESFDRRRDGDKSAQICGSFMVILMPAEMIGIDLYHALAGDGEAIMWRRGLSGDGSPIATTRMETTPFDDQIVRYNLRSDSPIRGLPEFTLGADPW